MLKNYVLVTIRNLRKNSVYSLINIGGLSIGITCSLLIFLWVFDELSFDTFLPKSDRIYRVVINSQYDGKINTWSACPLAMGDGLKPEHQKISNTVITDWGNDHLLASGDWEATRTGIKKNGLYASEAFLDVFEFPLVSGMKTNALADQNSIVITESVARALFGDEDAIGKTIRIDNQHDMKVTAVLKDIPKNSTIQFNYLLPWKLYLTMPWVKDDIDNWGNYSWPIYAELQDPADEAPVEEAIRDLLHRKGQTDIKREVMLHPMKRWRLYAFEDGKEKAGLMEYVQMFTVIAVFIILIACINFMNLATARSEKRAKEVGIRKSIGSRKMELIAQFLGESLFITLLAFGIALLLAQLLLPFYNELVDKKLTIPYASSFFWLLSVTMILLIGIIAGSYPAFYLSSFKPVQVLKGKVKVGKAGSAPRKILVTLQFGFSILLIIGTLVIYQQIQHVKNRDLGYDQERLLTIPNNDDTRKNYKAIKQELLQTGVVVSVTKSNSAITEIQSWNFVDWPGKPQDQRFMFSTIATEYDYMKTMGIKVLEGRDFSEDFKSDTAAVILNKAGIDLIGFEDPIGMLVDIWGAKRQIIGVVDNTLMGSPYETVSPMMVMFIPDWVNSITIRLEKNTDVAESLKKVEAVFKKYTPAYPFEYSFADEQFDKKFKSIDMNSKLASLFATLAIIITGLGLFGLASFTAEQRTKEIGIRKVLGASITGLVGLIASDFSKLVIIAFAVSSPLAWWLLNKFLEQYPYRIDIPWWVFPSTGLIALIFALTIVSTQALRAARSNPVNSLRTE